MAPAGLPLAGLTCRRRPPAISRLSDPHAPRHFLPFSLAISGAPAETLSEKSPVLSRSDRFDTGTGFVPTSAVCVGIYRATHYC